MTNVSVAVVNFTRWGDGRTLEFASGVIHSLTNNPYFTTGAALTETVIAFDAYGKSLMNAHYGSRAEIARKNADKSMLIEALKALCQIVNYEQKNNREALLTSGFDISKESRLPVKLEPIERIELSYSDVPGSLMIKVQKGGGTRSVLLQFTTDTEITADTVWQTMATTRQKCTLTGLPVGQYIFLRAAAVGARGQSMYTAPLRKLVA